MRFVIKLKDGNVYTTPSFSLEEVNEEARFIDLIKTGIENNSTLELQAGDDQIIKTTWDEVYSVEIVL